MPGTVPNSVLQWWAAQPMGVRLFFVLNVSVYIGGLVVPPSWVMSSSNASRNLCIQGALLVAHPEQSWRMFTSAFTHGGLMHIG